MQTRQQKISFLKGLAKGVRTVAELAPSSYEVFSQIQLQTDAFRRTAKEGDISKIYTKADIEAFKRTRPNGQITVIVTDAELAPVLTERDIIWMEVKTYTDGNQTTKN